MKFTAAISFTLLAIFHSSYALAASSLELKYFSARGAAETSRLILALANAPYKDSRYEFQVNGPGKFEAPEFVSDKESGVLNANLGRVPILVVDGKDEIGQSRAIERFLAKRFGFMGDNDIDAAKIDCISEHCRDIKDASIKKGFSAFNKDKTDEEKAVARKEWFENDLPALLNKLEKSVQMTSAKEGFSVGAKDSYADITIFALIRDCSQADSDDVANAAASCTLLLSIADRIATNSNIAKWINERPKTFM